MADPRRPRRVSRALSRRLGGHPLYVWLVWALLAAALAASPVLLSDPAAVSFMIDPELFVLVIAVAAVYARAELGVAKALAARCRRGRTPFQRRASIGLSSHSSAHERQLKHGSEQQTLKTASAHGMYSRRFLRHSRRCGVMGEVRTAAVSARGQTAPGRRLRRRLSEPQGLR